MSWLKNALLSLRAAMTMAGPSATTAARPRAMRTTIQTAARKSLVQQTPQLIKQPATFMSRPGTITSAEELAWQMAWEKCLEQPSPHQRLAPYA